jgi:hypothetical protein
MTIEYRVSPPLTNETLNALFSIGWPAWQKAPDTSDWRPVLKRSLVYILRERRMGRSRSRFHP